MKELFAPELHTTDLEILSFTLVRVAYKLFGGDRMTMTYGTDVKIHGAEIHMLCHIKRNPGSHISGIARSIDVTRGAVSQLVKKLEQKGLVRKAEHPENMKQLTLVLTEKGETAYAGHQRLHQRFSDSLEEVLVPYTDEQFHLISRFMKELEGSIDILTRDLFSEEEENRTGAYRA
ncbi:MAG: MarR family transcriptional regulator [Spirochaetia bacterium]|nr:MarR family transcriptional regulator [Spirochaetia bacterium]